MKILSEGEIKLLSDRLLEYPELDDIFCVVYENNRELIAFEVMAKNNYEIRLEGGE